MFKPSTKVVARSLYESIIKHKKELSKPPTPNTQENWINGMAGRLIRYAVEESSKFNTKSRSSTQINEEEIFKALQKAVDYFAEVLVKDDIKN